MHRDRELWVSATLEAAADCSGLLFSLFGAAPALSSQAAKRRPNMTFGTYLVAKRGLGEYIPVT